MGKTINASYELWFRSPYQEGLASKSVYAAVRPGDRRFPLPKGVRIGEIARVRIIVQPGSEERSIKPVFNSFEAYVRIVDLIVKTIADLSPDDLRFCSQDARNPDAIKDHLQKIYGHHFGDRELATVICWEYLKENHP